MPAGSADPSVTDERSLGSVATVPRTTRDDVIAAAGKLFAERGFHGTSMRDLGEELGLLGSSLYSHVSGKDELLVEVISRGASLFEAAADAALSDDADPATLLRRLVAGHVDVLVDHEGEARTFLDEARFLEPGERSKAVGMRDAYEARWRAVIADGVRSGAFRADVDPKLASILTLSTINAMVRWYDPTGPLSRRQIVDAIAGFALDGLR